MVLVKLVIFYGDKASCTIWGTLDRGRVCGFRPVQTGDFTAVHIVNMVVISGLNVTSSSGRRPQESCHYTDDRADAQSHDEERESGRCAWPPKHTSKHLRLRVLNDYTIS